MISNDIKQYIKECFLPTEGKEGYTLEINYKRLDVSVNGMLHFEMTEKFWERLEERCVYSIYPGSVSIELKNPVGSHLAELKVLHKDTGTRLFTRTMNALKLNAFLEKQSKYIVEIGSVSVAEAEVENKKPSKPVVSAEVISKEIALLKSDGTKILLPKTELKGYSEIKKRLDLAGGTYNVRGHFDFDVPTDEILARLINGEIVNDKKKYQFFETTDALSDRLMEKLELKSNESWMEPSAGRAKIANKMRTVSSSGVVVELMPNNVIALKEMGYKPIEGDFLAIDSAMTGGKVDKIGANPPFCDDQDIKHIMWMFNEHLKSGGRLVSYASRAWLTPSTKLQKEFKSWLESIGGTYELIDGGEFKESGTMWATSLITINKCTDIVESAA